ncbi:hypothetical protein GCM10029964_093140 [Kibdelosporangium lantanae]
MSKTTRNDPQEFDVTETRWDGRRLLYADVVLGPLVRVEDQASRDRIAQTIAWSLRYAGTYTVAWPAGRAAFTVSAAPALPTLVDEQPWGEVPGIPIGVTDEQHADGWIDTVDDVTGEVVGTLPIALVNPATSQRHYLVIGGTGAGKSVWIRGFIARGCARGGGPVACTSWTGRAVRTTSCSRAARASTAWPATRRNGPSGSRRSPA